MASSDDAASLQLVGESLEVSLNKVETARVRLTTVTHTRDVAVDAELTSETAEIERRPVGVFVETVPEIRREGDTIVIPVVEEVLVVERRLRLKEETRVRVVVETTRHHEVVQVREQAAAIRHLPAAATQHADTSLDDPAIGTPREGYPE
jgi:stress response protein YsnF